MGERAFSIPFFRSNHADSEAPRSETGPAVDWADWLAQLKALLPEAGEWRQANAFIDAVQRIARQKHHQIEYQHKLQQALSEVATQCAESLLFFGIAAMKKWDSKACPMSDAQQAIAQCEALRSLLTQYQEERQIPQAKTLTKDLPRRKALLELEGQITQVYGQLSQIFDAAPTSQPSAADKEDKPIDTAVPSSAKDLASPPLSSSIALSAAQSATAPAEPTSMPVYTSKTSPETHHVLDGAIQEAPPLPRQSALTEERKETSAGKTVGKTVPVLTVPVLKGQDDEDSLHPPLDGAARQYNPLTYAQEHSLAAIRSGVGFVFASEALGLSHIIEAYKRVLPTDMPNGKKVPRTEIPAEVTTAEQLQRWFGQYCQEHSSDERLMTYRILGQCSKEQLRDQVQAALDQIKQTKKIKVQLSVLFFFDRRATWTWLSLPPDERTMLEGQLKALIFPRRWNAVGIRHRLAMHGNAQHGKLDTEETCEAILRATGGWPYLLDVLFYRCGTQQDPGPTAETIEKEFQEKNTKLGQQFRHCLGLGGSDSAQRVLEFIRDQQPVALKHVTPKALGGEPLLSSSECWTAIEYLQRTGCVDLHKGEFYAEPIAGEILSRN